MAPQPTTHRLQFRADFDADGDAGFLRARVCELDAVDRIGLVIARGGLIEERRPAIISGWSHSAVRGDMPPVGDGIVFEDGNFLMAEGQFDLEMASGKDAWRAVQRMKETVEFSILLHVLREDWQERNGDYYPVVTEYDVSEWSACQQGVSYNTGVDEMRAGPQRVISNEQPRHRQMERRLMELRYRAIERRSADLTGAGA